MLILAGVSINAVVGDNGILTRTQYASFLNEMAAVEEAVQLWKTGETIESNGEESKAIPANGLCKANELTETERLVGEVGYYRIWSMSETQPTTNILSDASTFNSSFESELVFYPAGVQDLYYLNNDALGIKENKSYLMDASTGMIYSMTGIGLKGVRCYSSNMAKAVMNGESTAPLFAEAEVSGSGSSEALAGNVQSEYLEDGSLNPNYNPNGFQIIASPNSKNVYKLYNNGDLYAKGVKGTQLVTADMSEIDPTKWGTFSVPSSIGEYSKIIQGYDTIYVIDTLGNLYAWGDNSENKLGLSYEQQVEYTGREPVKLNLYGKKVEKVFDVVDRVFVVVINDEDEYELYGCGTNLEYKLGTGDTEAVNAFTAIDVPNPEKIKCFISSTEQYYYTLIEYNDNTFYIAGGRAKNYIGNGSSGAYKKFVPIWNGYTYSENSNGEWIAGTYSSAIDLDSTIVKVIQTDAGGMIRLKNDGSIDKLGSWGWVTFPSITTGVRDIYSTGYGFIIWYQNGDIYGSDGVNNDIGTGTATKNCVKLQLPNDLVSSGIKEIFTMQFSAVYYLDNDGFIYASSRYAETFDGLTVPTGIKKISTIPKIETFYNTSSKIQKVYPEDSVYKKNTQMFLGKDNNLYSIGDSEIIFGDKILQSSWTNIASNVDDVIIGDYDETIGYISEGNLYVAGNDARSLGLDIDEMERVTEFTQVDDELINGHVKSFGFSRQGLFVLTDEGKLYATGKYTYSGSIGWPGDNWQGWGELEDHYKLVEIPILDGEEQVEVTYLSTGEYSKNIIAGGKIYCWGASVISNSSNNRIPTLLNVTGVTASKVIKMTSHNRCNQILDSDGNYFSRYYYSGYSDTTVYDWNKLNSQINNEKVIDIVRRVDENAELVLTEKGNVYGRGPSKYLGLGESSKDLQSTFKKLDIENVIQIISGYNCFLAVKADGTVWGTGSNTYGILGRWIGIDRKSPNSRYKTAFEWVECPELEI